MDELQYKNVNANIQIKKLTIDWNYKALLQRNVEVKLLDISAFTMTISGENKQEIEGSAHFSGIMGQANQYQGYIHVNVNAGTLSPLMTGKITFDGKLQGTQDKTDFMAKIMSSGMSYEKTPIPPQTIDLNLQWQKNTLQAKTSWIINAAKNLRLKTPKSPARIDGDFTIKPFRFFSLDPNHLEKQRLSGNVLFSLDSLDFLNMPTSPLKKIQGSLQAKIKLAGTLAVPLWEGVGQLNARSEIPELGLRLNNMDLTLNSNAKKMNLTGSITSGNKILSITGESFAPFTQAFTAKLSGNDFPLMNTKEYQIHITPDIQIQWEPGKIVLNGTVNIPYARIEPMEFSGALALPSDVEFVTDDQAEDESLLLIDSQIKVILGKDVQLKTHGISGNLSGTVLVTDESNEPTVGDGIISLIDAQYEAYGQKLKLDKGQATFSNSPIDNPQLSVRATRVFSTTSTLSPISNSPIPTDTTDTVSTSAPTQFDKITVGIEVTGYLKNPIIRLFSIPATLSQSDILSFLVLGRPMSQASSADGALLVSALSSMNMGGLEASQITQQLQRTFGLDVLNVETNSQYDPSQNTMVNSTALVLGKMLSPRLFVNYSIGLLQDSNVVTVKYFLTPKWIFQTETDGVNQGVDFFYSFTRD